MTKLIASQFYIFHSYIEEIEYFSYLTESISDIIERDNYIHSLSFNISHISEQIEHLNLNFDYFFNNKEYLNESTLNILNYLFDQFLIIRMKFETNKKIISLQYKTVLKEL